MVKLYKKITQKMNFKKLRSKRRKEKKGGLYFFMKKV